MVTTVLYFVNTILKKNSQNSRKSSSGSGSGSSGGGRGGGTRWPNNQNIQKGEDENVTNFYYSRFTRYSNFVCHFFVTSYNTLIGKEELIANSKSQVAAQLESRFDALKSLIAATKQYWMEICLLNITRKLSLQFCGCFLVLSRIL